jgi:hypothetical protein
MYFLHTGLFTLVYLNSVALKMAVFLVTFLCLVTVSRALYINPHPSFPSIPLSETYVQNVPGGKVNIVGGHSIGHSKQKNVYVHVSYSERFPRLILELYSSIIINKKEIIRKKR